MGNWLLLGCDQLTSTNGPDAPRAHHQHRRRVPPGLLWVDRVAPDAPRAPLWTTGSSRTAVGTEIDLTPLAHTSLAWIIRSSLAAMG